MDHAALNSGADDGMPSWDEIQARHQAPDDYRVVEFHAPEVTSNPFYSRGYGPAPEVIDHASNGTLWRSSTASGEQALFDHMTRRR
jgi:hypothetical protein